MKIKLILCFLVFNIYLFGLIINKEDLDWQPGLSHTYYQGALNSEEIDLTPGENKTWNFPSFTADNYRTYTAFSIENAQGTWTHADLRLHWDYVINNYPGTGDTYFDIGDTDYFNMGTSTRVESPNTPPIAMRFPHQLGNSFTSNHTTGTQSYTVNADVIAQGTATIVLGTFETLLIRIEYAYSNYSYYFYQWETVEYGVIAESVVNNYNDVLFVLNSVDGTELVCDFNANSIQSAVPFIVNFIDTSSPNPTAWEWDFDNDGNIDSTEQNPSYEYTEVGTYTVKLKVSYDDGNFVSKTKQNFIEVSGITNSNTSTYSDIKNLKCYPNPFNPSTSFYFSLKKSSNVNLYVYNLLGQKVKTIHKGHLSAGNHIQKFDASNLSSGIYFVKLKTNKSSLTKKIMLLK